jgi:hypothetical protein
MIYVKNFNTAKKDKKGQLDYDAIADKMIEHFNKNIIINKSFVDALNNYKGNGYIGINSLLYKQEIEVKQPNIADILLTEFVNYIHEQNETQNTSNVSNNTKTESSNLHKIRQIILKRIYQQIYTDKVVPVIDTIKTIDEIFIQAPELGFDNIVVYRGMSTDISTLLECKDGKYFITFPNYLSTSFKPSVSKSFSYNGQGILCTIHIPSSCKGLYITWDLNTRKQFDDLMIDNEQEYIIMRGSKFEVLSIENVRISSPRYITYNELKCTKAYPLIMKHYVLKLVQQPTIDELKKSVDELYDTCSFTVASKQLSRITTHDFKRKKRSRNSKHQSKK